jgi:hypothetical protein
MVVMWSLLVQGTGVALAVGVLRFHRRQRFETHRKVFNRLALPNLSGDAFDARATVLLPPPASRYLRHAIKPGAPLARTVDLHMLGEIRVRPEGDWFRFEAAQRICPERGFLWTARIEAAGRLSADGSDYLCDGQAGTDFFLGGLIPLAGVRGGEYQRSATGRLLIESIWLPSSFVADLGAEWEPGDEHRVSVKLPGQAAVSGLNMTVAESGALVDVSMMRHQGGEGRSFGLMPYGLRVEAEDWFGDYRVPSRVTAVWGYGTDAAEEFMRIKVEDARFL